MKIKFIVFIATFISFVSFGFSLDLSFAGHFDTYSGSNSGGFSFDATETIIPKLALNAKLDYFSPDSYEAQCLVLGNFKLLSVGAGIAYSMDNTAKNIIVPGLGFTATVKLPLNLGLNTAAIISLAPANLYKSYSFRVKGAILFDTPNAHSSINYSLKQSAEKEGLLHSTLFRVDAFEKNIPFTIMLGFGADFLTHTENPVQIEGSIIGGFSIITKKLGTYFVEGKVSPITYRDIDIPFEIKAGASFLLD